MSTVGDLPEEKIAELVSEPERSRPSDDSGASVA